MCSNSFVRAERTFHLRFHWYRAWATMSCIPLRGISVTTEVVTPVRLVATRIVRLEHKVISILAWVRTRRWSYPHRGHYAFGLMQINTARKICRGGDALSGIDVLKKVFWVRTQKWIQQTLERLRWQALVFALLCTMSSTEFRKERCSYLTFLFLTLESGRFWFIVLGDLYHCFWIFLTRFILFTTLLNVYSRQNEITCKLNRRQLRQDSELCQNDARS